jgi:hypothetical protein
MRPPSTNKGGRTTYSPGRIVIQCLTFERIILAYAGIGNMNHPLLNAYPADPNHIPGRPKLDSFRQIHGWGESGTDGLLQPGAKPIVRRHLGSPLHHQVPS